MIQILKKNGFSSSMDPVVGDWQGARPPRFQRWGAGDIIRDSLGMGSRSSNIKEDVVQPSKPPRHVKAESHRGGTRHSRRARARKRPSPVCVCGVGELRTVHLCSLLRPPSAVLVPLEAWLPRSFFLGGSSAAAVFVVASSSWGPLESRRCLFRRGFSS